MDTPPTGQVSNTDAKSSAREAATWFARLLDDNVPEGDYARFREWVRADPANAEAYARLERLWTQAASEPAAGNSSSSRRTFLTAASGIILLTGAGAGALTLFNRADFSTTTGEVREITLVDGSRVELSAASAISVNFSASSRNIVLHSGEAYFSVKPDNGRPFVVEADAIRATALGTEYSVARSSDRISISVTQHSVLVEADGQRRELAEGDTIDWRGQRFESVKAEEAGTRLSWRSQQLVFLARPLNEVVTEINRWRQGRLVVLDPALAARPVTAIIDLSDIGGIDKTLAQGLPVKLTDYTSFVTLVSAR